MRVALLHVDVSGGPESHNLEILSEGIGVAAAAGASWVVTPETAVQGYFFACERESKLIEVPVQPSAKIEPILKSAAKHRLTVFLGCAERDAVTGKHYNSCLVIGPDGTVIGRHRKKQAHKGVSEGWAAKGEMLEPVKCGDRTAGILICADSWYAENAVELAGKGAEILVVPAAWPPNGCGGPPENAWKRASRASGRALWVCNQTGKQERLDFTHAQSAVVVSGEMRLAYAGKPAVLVFDWDFAKECVGPGQFAVLPI
ncbi:carbon-nitrogen hydrolase family protein [Sporomusa acidovorans]|uniref:Formamidase n=1 Tax=Sporomusa acidovorans (strain ATCC 49682 / DSM 3132 / Mol) TaxID=1123286 RepID=A0ABZ3IYC7_SPOA4|nr:carbon-nitrogen hydrolase family protein [Sporomusa acidovorans]OZC17658.1 formamidase [Sporomusa acidovorans DSM 3132]SDE11231.1 Carbon-nitrogen hydrolase [Sporomusa acidovorans]